MLGSGSLDPQTSNKNNRIIPKTFSKAERVPMKIQREFSENAKAYDQVNVIQRKVIDRMLSLVNDTPATILDIGCGSGTLYRMATWDITSYTGVDFAKGMLERHPKGEGVTLLEADFNDPQTFAQLGKERFDRIFSASALQWAKDLNGTLERIAALEAPVSLAIFTSNTFKTLYRTAGLPPLLRSREEVTALLQKHFPDAQTELLHYTLAFPDVRAMFRYMKKSGVGAGRNLLGYKEMRALMRDYPLDHLEYEIILLHEKKRR